MATEIFKCNQAPFGSVSSNFFLFFFLKIFNPLSCRNDVSKFNLFLYFWCLDLKKYSVDIIVSKTKTVTRSFKSPTFAFAVKRWLYPNHDVHVPLSQLQCFTIMSGQKHSERLACISVMLCCSMWRISIALYYMLGWTRLTLYTPSSVEQSVYTQVQWKMTSPACPL